MGNVLVLGATSAIAAAVARRYAARGDRLYLVGRSQAKLDALRVELGPAVVGHATVDFTDHARSRSAVAEALESLGRVDIALVAHGMLGDQLRTEADFGAAREVIDVNFTSVIALLVPLANALEGQRGGHLAVITSVAAERGRPRNFTYGAAKAGVNTYLEGLRSRLYPAGVQVHVLKPGPVDTPMTTDHPKNALFASVDRVADGIVRAIDGGRSVAWLPGFWGWIMPIVRALPEPMFQRVRALSGR